MKYVQSVQGIVNLIGGIDVGLVSEISSGNVVVKAVADDLVVEEGWLLLKGEYFPPKGTALSFEEQKAIKISDIDAACSASIFGGVSYDGHVFPSAPMDIIYLMGAKDTLTRHPQIPWDTLDVGPGSYVMTAEKYAGLVIAFEDSRIGHQMKVNTLKAQAESAKTPEELATIVW